MTERRPPRKPPRSLREYLDRPGALTQRQLGAAAGTHQSMISMLASGKRTARGQLALRLHAVTGVPLEALIAPRRSPRRRTTSTPTTTTPPTTTTHATT